MRKLIGMGVLLLCSACARERPELPTSDIEFVSVSHIVKYEHIDTRFTSNTDLLKYFLIHTGQDESWNMMSCSLDAVPHDDSREGISHELTGLIDELEHPGQGGRHFYSARLIATETDHEYGLSTFLSKAQLLEILSQRSAVTCRFKSMSWSYGPYQSQPMGIPAADLARVVEQWRSR